MACRSAPPLPRFGEWETRKDSPSYSGQFNQARLQRFGSMSSSAYASSSDEEESHNKEKAGTGSFNSRSSASGQRQLADNADRSHGSNPSSPHTPSPHGPSPRGPLPSPLEEKDYKWKTPLGAGHPTTLPGRSKGIPSPGRELPPLDLPPPPGSPARRASDRPSLDSPARRPLRLHTPGSPVRSASDRPFPGDSPWKTLDLPPPGSPATRGLDVPLPDSPASKAKAWLGGVLGTSSSFNEKASQDRSRSVPRGRIESHRSMPKEVESPRPVAREKVSRSSGAPFQVPANLQVDTASSNLAPDSPSQMSPKSKLPQFGVWEVPGALDEEGLTQKFERLVEQKRNGTGSETSLPSMETSGSEREAHAIQVAGSERAEKYEVETASVQTGGRGQETRRKQVAAPDRPSREEAGARSSPRKSDPPMRLQENRGSSRSPSPKTPGGSSTDAGRSPRVPGVALSGPPSPGPRSSNSFKGGCPKPPRKSPLGQVSNAEATILHTSPGLVVGPTPIHFQRQNGRPGAPAPNTPSPVVLQPLPYAAPQRAPHANKAEVRPNSEKPARETPTSDKTNARQFTSEEPTGDKPTLDLPTHMPMPGRPAPGRPTSDTPVRLHSPTFGNWDRPSNFTEDFGKMKESRAGGGCAGEGQKVQQNIGNLQGPASSKVAPETKTFHHGAAQPASKGMVRRQQQPGEGSPRFCCFCPSVRD